MKDYIVKVAGLILMVVSFIAFLAKAPAFPIASENIIPWWVWFTISVLVNMFVWYPVMKLVSFSIFVIWSYAFIAALVPDTSTASGTLEVLDWADPDGVAEQGEVIFNGKGQCAACHTLDTSAPKGRCPDLSDIGAIAANRQPGIGSKQYLIESLYNPAKYLVPGYGKIMPEVWKNPIALSKIEIEAVIAFLQSQGGEIDPTPFDEPIDRADIGTSAEILEPLLTGDIEKGKKVFIDTACISCHVVKGVENPKAGEENVDFEVVTAPELSDIAAINEMRYIEESVLLPHAEIVPGYASVKVTANGILYEGTLVSQDEESIVVKTKADDGTETEHTILFSDIDEEPIEDLTDLKDNGYFTVTITPAGAETPISGEIVEETADTVTIKMGDETQTVSKTDVKMQMTLIDFDGIETTGEIISGDMDSDEIIMMVDGNEESFDPFDFDFAVTALATGKNLHERSPMPDNFPILLSVEDLANLLAFLSSLTGATEAEDTTNGTTEASTDNVTDTTTE